MIKWDARASPAIGTPRCAWGLLLALSPLAAAVADARKDGETELPDMVISGESTSATQPPGVTTLGKVPLQAARAAAVRQRHRP
ncbi:hypothetical protein ACPA9J_24055 [Pseudomonas aeruginosa]